MNKKLIRKMLTAGSPSQLTLLEFKQRDKMNILEFLKNGSGIHIKKKNKGKFTSYCGGKVTDECILKGKNSSNPAIRKRATFAANARKWKHLQGGIVKSQLGGNTSNYQLIGSALSNIISTGVSAYSLYKQAEAEAKKQKALTEEELAALKKLLLKDSMEKMRLVKELWQKDYAEGKTIENFSNIVNQHLGFLNYTQDIAEAEQNAKNKNALIDADKNSLLGLILSNALSGIALEGIGTLSNYIGNKLSSSKNSAPSNTSSVTSLYNTSFYKPDSSNLIYTTKYGGSNSVDDWRKLMGIQ